jgi:hypothetical protein
MIRIYKKKRVRSLQQFAPLLKGKRIAICIDISGHEIQAQRAGFSKTLSTGESVIPAIVGTITRQNIYGKEIVRRDKPMEIHYRQKEWTRNEFRGRYETVEVTDMCEVPYRKYPRDLVAPQGIELRIAQNKVTSPVYSFPEDEIAIIHAVNLFLETFGECCFVDEELQSLMEGPTRSLNWKVLPPGEMPWTTLKEHLEPILAKAKPQNRKVFENRLEIIQAYKPKFRAFGMGGYEGYVVFGFENKGVYICESIRHGNAIYVFDENWEDFSQKTKAEVVQRGLQKERIIHYGDWQKKVSELLGEDSKQIYKSAVEKPRPINPSNTFKQASPAKFGLAKIKP